MDTLVLNAACQPIGRVSWEKAITLWYLEKAEILEEYCDKWIHSTSLEIKMPSVIRLITNFFFRRPASKFSRKSVYRRDEGICQYCVKHTKFAKATLDHIIPRSKGGPKTWENVVLACKKCNQKKGDKMPHEVGMKLLKKPERPKSWLDKFPESWNNWLNGHI